MSENNFFELEVAKIYRRGNKTKMEAIQEATAKHPDLHAEYVLRVNKCRKLDCLNEALTK
jgi:hypothetical protein